MTRARLDYGAASVVLPAAAILFDPDTPVAGLYRMRLRSEGAFVGVRLWFGQPREPWTGEIMDRAPCWNAQINGEWAEVERVWPKCAADPIDEAEHQHLVALRDWAVQHAPDSGLANPFRRLDPLTTPLLF